MPLLLVVLSVLEIMMFVGMVVEDEPGCAPSANINKHHVTAYLLRLNTMSLPT